MALDIENDKFHIGAENKCHVVEWKPIRTNLLANNIKKRTAQRTITHRLLKFYLIKAFVEWRLNSDGEF